VDYAYEKMLDAIMCVGMNPNTKNSGGPPNHPRMHHKFLVFGNIACVKIRPRTNHRFDYYFDPIAVWTGSFNASKNSGNSLKTQTLQKLTKRSLQT
jgi:hypothetical protein